MQCLSKSLYYVIYRLYIIGGIQCFGESSDQISHWNIALFTYLSQTVLVNSTAWVKIYFEASDRERIDIQRSCEPISVYWAFVDSLF